jgi:type I restriction enzyme, S subunit
MVDGWRIVTLGEVLHLQIDAVPVDPTQYYPISGVYGFGRGLIAREPLLGSQTTYKVFHRLHENDYVLSQVKGWEGALARVTAEFDGWYLSPQFPTFRANPDYLDIRYLEWYCRQRKVWEQLRRKSRGIGARRETISAEKFLTLQIPLPPLDEQRRIVAHIDALAGRIAEARGLRAGAVEEGEELINAELIAIFSQLLQSQSIRLDKAANLERGRFSHRPRNEPRFFGGNHPWIQIGEIQSAGKYIYSYTETLNDDGLAISKKFPKGTLLISIAATIGAVGILDFDCCVPDSIVAITPYTGHQSEFIYYYLLYLRSYLERIAPQSAQKNINLRILTELPYPKVSSEAQAEIVAYLDALHTQVDALKRLQAECAAELDALLPSVLDGAFRGEI